MKVKSVKTEQYSGKVYNFHCMPHENYFDNGILVHNCYKANTGNGTNMSLETFKKLFAKLPPTISQIAFGLGSIVNAEAIYELTINDAIIVKPGNFLIPLENGSEIQLKYLTKDMDVDIDKLAERM